MHQLLSLGNKNKLNVTSLTLRVLLLDPVRKFVPITTDSEMGVFPNRPFNAVRSSSSHSGGFHTMKLSIKDLTKVLSAVVAVACGHNAFGQATQNFTVEVASSLTISAPGDLTIPHDTTDSNQGFGVSDWTVTCNNGAGATVDFTTTAVFENGAVERDLTMEVSIVSTDTTALGANVWSVTPALTSYTSDYASADRNGQVQATSAGPGNATLGLSMTFVDNDYSLLPSGNYTVQVTGTITAN